MISLLLHMMLLEMILTFSGNLINILLVEVFGNFCGGFVGCGKNAGISNSLIGVFISQFDILTTW